MPDEHLDPLPPEMREAILRMRQERTRPGSGYRGLIIVAVSVTLIAMGVAAFIG